MVSFHMLNYRVNQTSDYCLPSDLYVNHQPRGPQQQKLQPLGAPKSHEIGEPKPLLFRRHSNLWRKTAWTCSIYVHLMFIHVILNKSEFFCCWLFSLPTSFVGPLDFQRIIVAKRQSFSKWPREASTNKFCGLCDKEVKGGSRPMLMAIFTYTYSCMCIYYMNIYIVILWIYEYIYIYMYDMSIVCIFISSLCTVFCTSTCIIISETMPLIVNVSSGYTMTHVVPWPLKFGRITPLNPPSYPWLSPTLYRLW